MADGITRIAVEGFKSIAKRQEIEIRPLTILAGANSSGKSSIMQPLLMLKQTLEATYDPGPLKIDGPNVTFTSSDQFLSRSLEPIKRLVLKVTLSADSFSFIFSKGPAQALEISEESMSDRVRSAVLQPGMTSEQLRQSLGNVFALGGEEYSVVRNRVFLDVVGGDARYRFMDVIEPFVRGLIHVPSLRSMRSRTYPVAGIGPAFQGTFEYYVASVVSDWQSSQERAADSLNQDLKQLGLTQQIRARKLTETEIDLQVSRLADGRADDMVSIADVGSGVSQTLPVLVALRAAEGGRLVYLEEPEIHLHPRAQTRLADILADAAKRGVRVVAETHSSLLLTAVQTLVAKGELDSKLVKLHWFQRDAETGNTYVTSADLDENGAFGDWPEDFGDLALRSEQNYLDAVETKLAR